MTILGAKLTLRGQKDLFVLLKGYPKIHKMSKIFKKYFKIPQKTSWSPQATHRHR